MSLTCKTINKTVFQVEWRVVVPRVGKKVESPFFNEDKRRWYFVFSSKCASEEKCDEIWEIKLYRYSGQIHESSLLTVHVKSKNGRNEIMSWNEIDGYNPRDVWNSSRDSFLQKYPAVDFSTSTLTFIFTFHYGIQTYQDCQNEDKSVQTDSPPLTQCLENLSLDLRKLMDDGSDVDVHLKCGDCTISAHRLILGARSEVFRSMLKSDMLEGRQGAAEIVDMEPEVFQVFVRYLYTGHLPELSVDTALPLFEAADKYHVEALKDRCRDFLADNLTREIACEVLATADAHSDEKLKDSVISYILDEEIPKDVDMWLKFSDSHPKLANQVLYCYYKKSVCSE